MPILVLVLLAAVALAAWFWEFSRSTKPARPEPVSAALVVVAGLAAAFGLFKLTNLPLVAAAPVVAAIAAVLSATTTGCPDKSRASLVALGALPTVMAQLAGPANKDWVWIGAFLVGVSAFGFWANWTKAHRADAAVLPLATVASAMLLLFLKIQSADYGVPVTGALVLTATLGLALSTLFAEKRAWVKPVLGVVVSLASALVFQLGFHKAELALVVGMAGVTALVIGWLWGDDTPSPTAGALGALAWTGVATFGFSLAQTSGMAAAALVGLGVLAVIGRPSAVAAMSPLFALGIYRLLRNLSPETLDSFDIGQHYVTVGLLIGTAVAVAVNEFVSGLAENGGPKVTGAMLAAWLAAAGLAGFASVFLGERATVGVVIGLALGGALSSLSGRAALPGAVFGCGLAWLASGLAPAMIEAVDFKKDTKMAVFAVAVLIVAGLAATAGWLARPMKEESSAQA